MDSGYAFLSAGSLSKEPSSDNFFQWMLNMAAIVIDLIWQKQIKFCKNFTDMGGIEPFGTNQFH